MLFVKYFPSFLVGSFSWFRINQKVKMSPCVHYSIEDPFHYIHFSESFCSDNQNELAQKDLSPYVHNSPRISFLFSDGVHLDGSKIIGSIDPPFTAVYTNFSTKVIYW